MRIRALAALFASTLIVAMSVSASGSGEKAAASKGPVTLRYALWDGGQQPAMQAAIQGFEKQNPNVNVTVELTEWNDYWTKIQAGVAAGTTPDVFWGHVAYFATLADKGALENLAPYIAKDNIDLSVYYPGLVDNWKYKGNQYGLAKDWDTICYAYNTGMLQKAGVDPNNLQWNPNDGGTFLQALQKLTVDKNGKNASQPGFDPNNVVQYGIGGISAGEIQTGWLSYAWENGAPGSVVLDKPFGTTFTLTDPQAVAALQFYADLVNKYHVAPSPSGNQGFAGNGQDLFLAKKVAMFPAGSWTLASTRANATFDWDVAPLPVGPNGRVTPFNGLAHVMYSGTKNKDAAWDLIKWMDGPNGEAVIASYAVVFPSIKSILPTYMKAFAGKAPASIHYYTDEAAGKVGPYPQSLVWGQVWDIVQRELESAMSGTVSVKDAMTKAKAEVDPLLQ